MIIALSNVMPHYNIIVPDPHVSIGDWKVLLRTDGKCVLYDPNRPLGQNGVALFRTLEGATSYAERQLGLQRVKAAI